MSDDIARGDRYKKALFLQEGHTPGPWEVDVDTRDGGLHQTMVMASTPDRMDDGTLANEWIADVGCLWHDARGECEMANAQLIAAAPDLLAELKKAMDMLCQITPGTGSLTEDDRDKLTGTPYETILDLRQAIAKTQGGEA